MVSPAPDHTNRKSMTESETDEAFEKLLSSQRDILARLDFGNSQELQYEYAEGPDNLTVVSPHASTEFHTSEYESYTNTSAEFHASYTGQPFEEEAYFPPSPYAMGIGDDSFILEEITIGPGEEKGPAVFEVDAETGMKRRKRDTEQELMGVVARRKKRRNGSMGMDMNMVHTSVGSPFYNRDPDTAFCDDLLPGPSDLEGLDASSRSLSLEDLDFPSIHSENDGGMWKPPRERAVTEDDCKDQKKAAKEESTPSTPSSDNAMDTDDKTMKAVDAKVPPKLNPCVSMDEDNARPRPPRRSQGTMWKPRPRATDAKMSMADQRSLWKPRKRQSVVPSANDSCASLQMEDLESSNRFVARTVSSQSQQKTFHVSILEGDLDDKKCPSRTSSGESVKSLSNALQQSIGSTMSIQDWDKKMGLKRSHSKTMRQSAKTREQLLSLLKKEQQELAAAVTGLEGELNHRGEESKPTVVAL